ncbi:GxxExxY protein [Roseateles sp.]|uniref:GxxExxY protein n=1 Tax=Roseateles sp. TaxID=1971397 RepID=UPI00286BC0D8|nr:GxxExxY protein [Roseateles sp.]
MIENQVSEMVIGAAVEVHRCLGPGLLESAYANALAIELQLRNCSFERELGIRAIYKGQDLGVSYRADFLVRDCVLVELKAVDALSPQHEAQLLSYLRLSDKRLGLLINFNQPTLLKGLRRLVNQL